MITCIVILDMTSLGYVDLYTVLRILAHVLAHVFEPLNKLLTHNVASRKQRHFHDLASGVTNATPVLVRLRKPKAREDSLFTGLSMEVRFD